jgi:hypothetical protein
MPKTIQPCPDIRACLREAPPALKIYVAALQAENRKLQLQVGKYQAREVTLKNRLDIERGKRFKLRDAIAKGLSAVKTEILGRRLFGDDW